MANKPVTGLTVFGANTSGTTTQLDNNFLALQSATNDFNTYANYLVDTGSQNVVVVTLPANITGNLTDGLPLQVKVAATNTGGTTLNYNGTGGLNVKNLDGSSLAAGQLPAGSISLFQYRASDTSWILQTPFVTQPSITGRNRLINAAFILDQRHGGNNAVVLDATYGFDRWRVLSQQASANTSQQTVQENGTPQNLRLTQTNATASRLGVEQVIESVNCLDMRGANAVLSARVRLSASSNIRYAILESTGNIDAPTADPVNNWDDSTYAAGNFFIAANMVVTATGVTALSANAWTNISPISGNVSANMNNLRLFLWTEANLAQNGTLDLSFVQAESGATPTGQDRVEYTTIVEQSQRYYEKTFPLGTAPVSAPAAPNFLGGELSCWVALAANAVVPWQFKSVKRTTPTITTYNPLQAGSGWRNLANTETLTAANVAAGTEGATIYSTAQPGGADLFFIHATAAAEL